MIVDYNWSDDFLDVEDYKELRAFQNAQLDAIRRARQFDSEFVIMDDNNKVIALRPNETLEIEKRGEEHLKELNEIIARLQAAAKSNGN
jgi:hypothetical protein